MSGKLDLTFKEVECQMCDDKLGLSSLKIVKEKN